MSQTHQLLTDKQVAAKLGVSERTLWRLHVAGKVPKPFACIIQGCSREVEHRDAPEVCRLDGWATRNASVPQPEVLAKQERKVRAIGAISLMAVFIAIVWRWEAKEEFRNNCRWAAIERYGKKSGWEALDAVNAELFIAYRRLERNA